MLAKILGFVALGLSGACLLLTILALALPYWQTYTIYNAFTKTTTDGHQGIFKSCAYDNCDDVLGNKLVSDAWKSSIRATQAMVLLGFFAMVGATAVLGVHLFIFKDRKMFGYIAGGLAIVSGFFLMVGFAVYADNVKLASADLGAGFAFDILAWLVAWAAGGIVVFMTFTGTTET